MNNINKTENNTNLALLPESQKNDSQVGENLVRTIDAKFNEIKTISKNLDKSGSVEGLSKSNKPLCTLVNTTLQILRMHETLLEENQAPPERILWSSEVRRKTLEIYNQHIIPKNIEDVNFTKQRDYVELLASNLTYNNTKKSLDEFICEDLCKRNITKKGNSINKNYMLELNKKPK